MSSPGCVAFTFSTPVYFTELIGCPTFLKWPPQVFKHLLVFPKKTVNLTGAFQHIDNFSRGAADEPFYFVVLHEDVLRNHISK